MPKLECRVVLEHKHSTFKLGMHDPVSGRYVPLGEHPNRDKERIVRDLSVAIERAGHQLSFSERWS